MNNVLLVGELIEKYYNRITIKIKGGEETDVTVYIPDNIYDAIEDNCNLYDIIGVKGHICRDLSGIYIKADRVSILGGTQ